MEGDEMKINVCVTDSNLVTIAFIVHAGSYNETQKTLGIAHFTEHLVFRGTQKFNNKQINTYIESLGGYMNAYTAYEFTKFYCTVPSNKWKEAVDFLNQIVFCNTIPADMFDIEKDIVINELKMYQDDPQSVAAENLYKIMFKQYNKQLVGGTPETVANITRQQVLEYIEQYYNTTNVDVVATGNINPDELKQYIDSSIHFQHNIITPVSRTIFNDPKEIQINKMDITQSVLMWGIVLPNIYDKMCAPSLLINNYLGGNASSILYDKVREELGLCYAINTSIENFKDYNILIGYTALNEINIKKVQNIITDTFNDIKMTQQELDNNKQYLTGQYLIRTESTSGLNELITTYGIDYDLMSKIDNVTLTDIQETLPIFAQDIYWSIVTPK